MNKQNVVFTHKRECRNCRALINRGFMHIANRYLTYFFCDEDCYNKEYNQ